MLHVTLTLTLTGCFSVANSLLAHHHCTQANLYIVKLLIETRQCRATAPEHTHFYMEN